MLLWASAVFAQSVVPGTLASAVLPELPLDLVPSFEAVSSSSSNGRRPITVQERIQWTVRGSIGPASLAGGLFSAGWGTLRDVPKTYGTHWQGFADRYGTRIAARAISNTMEAGLGSIWGEDPRYTRDTGAPLKNRLGHAFKMTFLAQNRAGSIMPAYARWVAFPSSNLLANTWRTGNEATLSHAAIGTGFKFLGRLSSNTFQEFRPDIVERLNHWRFLRPWLPEGLSEAR